MDTRIKLVSRALQFGYTTHSDQQRMKSGWCFVTRAFYAAMQKNR